MEGTVSGKDGVVDVLAVLREIAGEGGWIVVALVVVVVRVRKDAMFRRGQAISVGGLVELPLAGNGSRNAGLSFGGVDGRQELVECGDGSGGRFLLQHKAVEGNAKTADLRHAEDSLVSRRKGRSWDGIHADELVDVVAVTEVEIAGLVETGGPAEDLELERETPTEIGKAGSEAKADVRHGIDADDIVATADGESAGVAVESPVASGGGRVPERGALVEVRLPRSPT